jgi:hypothetical protein
MIRALRSHLGYENLIGARRPAGRVMFAHLLERDV